MYFTFSPPPLHTRTWVLWGEIVQYWINWALTQCLVHIRCSFATQMSEGSWFMICRPIGLDGGCWLLHTRKPQLIRRTNICIFPAAMKLKDTPWKESYDQPRQHIKKQRHYFVNRVLSSQGYGFSSSHVWMWELDYKESWVLKNWCFWIVVLEKTLEGPLNCKEIQPVNSKGDQSWVFIGRTDAEAETPIFWPPNAKSWLIWKDPDVGKDWGQEEKGTTEVEMVGWHHQLNGQEFG